MYSNNDSNESNYLFHMKALQDSASEPVTTHVTL